MAFRAQRELVGDVAVARLVSGAKEFEDIETLTDRLGRNQLGIAAIAHHLQRPLHGKASKIGVVRVRKEIIFPLLQAGEPVHSEDREIRRMWPDPHGTPELAQILIAVSLDPGRALIGDIPEDLAGNCRLSADEFNIDHATSLACADCHEMARWLCSPSPVIPAVTTSPS